MTQKSSSLRFATRQIHGGYATDPTLSRGIAIHPYANYGRPGTKFEQLAWERLSKHE